MSGAGPRWALVPTLLGALALLAERVDLDRALTRLWFDPQARVFPWRHAYLLDTVLHHWAKYLVVAMALAALAALAAACLVPRWRTCRRPLAYIVLGLVLAPAAVSAAKLASATPCPWDIAEFGGSMEYRAAHGHAPVHCFPAGHASAGYALMVFYFTGVAAGRRRHARRALYGGLAAGTLLGVGRMLQGAHFLSHTIWTGLVCWYVLLALYALMFLRTRGGPALK